VGDFFELAEFFLGGDYESKMVHCVCSVGQSGCDDRECGSILDVVADGDSGESLDGQGSE